MSSKKNIFILIGAILVIFCGIILLYLLAWKAQYDSGLNNPESQRNGLESSKAEATSPGEIGEISVLDKETNKQEPLVSGLMPEIISSTFANVVKVEENKIIVQGAGNNFADNQPRELICFFTEETLVFDKGKKEYNGSEGLKLLKPGMLILIEGKENIRGKTEFTAKTVNIY